ncbi:hypothetical protein QC761_311420 [Podospora bellae-mahoneyi]|uniref:Indole-diterpene biosynthesis protein PaxU n=1 Tax=Podospora bellae-mahoneyi TaxID=2093777 RepID=A0ABR0FM98_9PEZI|nr:hypothetical protein QC761_311420 [Podospora bellae-mahoneyi]
MASNTPTPLTKANNPLDFMTKISPSAYVYTPPTSTNSTSQNNDPKLLLLATWMGARDVHIAKYLLPYQSLYPSSSIVLLRSEPRHFFSKTSAPNDVAPVVPFVKSLFVGSPTPGDKTKPEVLIHLWSNGGSLMLHHLRQALTPEALPRYVIIYDSCPGQYRYLSAFKAFSAGSKGVVYWLLAPMLHLFCAWGWFWHVFIGRNKTGPLAYLNRGHNDWGKLGGREVRRGYIYSEGDELVHWRDVESHAEEARRNGFAVVKLEKFRGTGHVAHGRGEGNQERYWGVVRGLWEGRLE